MPYPEQERKSFAPAGPTVEGDGRNLPGFTAALQQTYGGENRGPVVWRGRVAFFFMGEPLFEAEGSMLESKQQKGEYWISWHQRPYQTQGGETKYLNTLYFNSTPLADLARKAVQAGLDDRPF